MRATSRAGAVVAAHGVRALWFRTLGDLGYRRQLITELRLPTGEAVPVARDDLELRFLSRDDLPAYADLHGAAGGSGNDAADRLAAGDRCFGVWSNGRLASTRWLATGRVRLPYLDRVVSLPRDTVLISETYTDPSLRGHGISAAAGVVLPALLAAEGVRRVVGVLEPENRAALRANAAAGYTIVGKVGSLRVGRWRRDFGEI